MSTGWSWDTIDREMDLMRLAALNHYWDRHPPLHLMVQSYLGIKPVSRSSASWQREADNTERDVQEFAEMFTAAGGLSA
ncbi:hypothetical protein OYT1_ch1272 [Ferriphaselus amnicola]|uniref:Uncharacterized protein n=1 Tax=Ferriphaselus amnicola TaxID=1188319 RepID=A0A2Z6GBS2_9PROT|nr:hypothetical protein [Ferriphaselus amnicola]BBE50829.1 hypothetical protein OYT1_ch1272 [Ferriphaselus amnicola]